MRAIPEQQSPEPPQRQECAIGGGSEGFGTSEPDAAICPGRRRCQALKEQGNGLTSEEK